jgi:hypothetical protein
LSKEVREKVLSHFKSKLGYLHKKN